jgi:hypothetical protein
MKSKLLDIVVCLFLVISFQQEAIAQEIARHKTQTGQENQTELKQVLSENQYILSKSKLASGEILLMNSSHQDIAWMDFLEISFPLWLFQIFNTPGFAL